MVLRTEAITEDLNVDPSRVSKVIQFTSKYFGKRKRRCNKFNLGDKTYRCCLGGYLQCFTLQAALQRLIGNVIMVSLLSILLH